MVFCIDKEKHKALSSLLSDVLSFISLRDDVSALILNSYLFYMNPYEESFSYLYKDGINISLTLVCKNDCLDLLRKLQSYSSLCKEELGYNLFFLTLSEDNLCDLNHGIRALLADGEVLFDKSGKTKNAQACIFSEKSDQAITYLPKLDIEKM